MSNVTGARDIIFALQVHGQDVERAVGDELQALVQASVVRMRLLAAKGATTALTNAIKAEPAGALAYDVGAFIHYARPVEEGVKPGGKGLPRFFDPASRSVVQWLRSKAFGGKRRARMGSRALQSAETELRDRYEGLAWHIRHKGTRAQPFFEPAVQELEATALTRLGDAVRNALAARPAGGAAA